MSRIPTLAGSRAATVALVVAVLGFPLAFVATGAGKDDARGVAPRSEIVVSAPEKTAVVRSLAALQVPNLPKPKPKKRAAKRAPATPVVTTRRTYVAPVAAPRRTYVAPKRAPAKKAPAKRGPELTVVAAPVG